MSIAKGQERGPLAVQQIRRGTMQEDVYRQAKQLILNGELAPGQSITIQWLADAFGVSAMPVREAILRLTAEKALTVVAGRSLGIPPLSRDRLADLTRTRLEIEALAVTWAVPNITRPIVGHLARWIEEMDNIKPDREARKVYLRSNREFHFTIYQASGSEALLGIIESLWLQVSPYFNLLHDRGNFVVSNHHHRRLADALAAGDAEAARSSVQADIREAASILDSVIT
ncbi:GntR family transcriptional regulator [Lichenifustis flavocetrariae]|uniref:GntR family transcriptional regulator n=1 Tax=Lichenifustis flavocetrariae TaxID=2949735 RepID=A0AA41YXW8_9HYPH|nr:GntR family transcriptional regulator [Lichenifustis flavocetrariae]MCW6506923.1 GntR family transcriptional regulator [Lichenifustis flavocetrariae]